MFRPIKITHLSESFMSVAMRSRAVIGNNYIRDWRLMIIYYQAYVLPTFCLCLVIIDQLLGEPDIK